MDDLEASFSSRESDESAEIQSLIDSYCQAEETERDGESQRKSKGRAKKKKRKKNNSLEHLKELMAVFEERGLFIPPPESLSEKGKVWSSRIYGADKKRQRKNAERQLLEGRIDQLEQCLRDQHGIDLCCKESGL